MRAHIMNASANGTKGSAWRLPAVYAGGVLFGFGLAYSGMARPEVVLDFLQLDDLGLLVVMGVAVVVAMLGFHVGPRLLGRAVAPLTGRRYQPRKLTFRPRVVGGAGSGHRRVGPTEIRGDANAERESRMQRRAMHRDRGEPERAAVAGREGSGPTPARSGGARRSAPTGAFAPRAAALLAGALVLLGGDAVRADAPESGHAWVGVDKCGRCHKKELLGNQVAAWREGPHARAFRTLRTEASRRIARELGLAGPPEEAPECLTCHASAFEVPAERLAHPLELEDGVRVETRGASRAWRSLTELGTEEEGLIEELVPVDDDLEAVFEYLVA